MVRLKILKNPATSIMPTRMISVFLFICINSTELHGHTLLASAWDGLYTLLYMADSKGSQQFIEADLRRLAAEVQSRKESGPQELSDRQIVREAIEFATTQPSTVSPAASDDSSVPVQGQSDASPLLPSYLQDATPEARLEVEYLVEEAFREGLDKATARAVTSSPYILDAFRDALAGKLHDELIRQGLLHE